MMIIYVKFFPAKLVKFSIIIGNLIIGVYKREMVNELFNVITNRVVFNLTASMFSLFPCSYM